GYSSHAVVRLVAHLHHGYVHICGLELLKRILGVLVKRVSLVIHAQAGPRLGFLPLTGISPEIGVVEVHQHGHANSSGPFADLDGACNINVASAITVTIGIEGVIPNPEPNGVNTALSQHVKQIVWFTSGIVESDTAIFQRNHRGNIGSHEEV